MVLKQNWSNMIIFLLDDTNIGIDERLKCWYKNYMSFSFNWDKYNVALGWIAY